MKYNSKKVLIISTILCLIISIGGKSFAHSGRTDSNGGHKDNKNKSGLGGYHYHCGGHEAHLHNNGICEYSSKPVSSSTSSNSGNTATTTLSSPKSESVTTTSSVKSTSEIAVTQVILASSVEINEHVTSMNVGESTNLSVTVEPENAEDKSIVWSSNDKNIATVSSTGKVMALKAGTVNITATTSNSKVDTITIIIEEVKEENNNIIVPSENHEISNESTNNTEDTDELSGVLGLGVIGGGSYFGYKKFKKPKK